MRFKLTIAYDGTNYAGWQVQPGHITVQEMIEGAIEATSGTKVKLHGSGRTDRGVHARGQVAHFDLDTRMTPRSMLFALNSRLPPDIRILSASRAAPDFHARRTAHSKEYRYKIFNGQILMPQDRLYAVQVHKPLDLAAMREGAARFVGEHDFKAFMANPQREIDSTVRTITAFAISKRGSMITLRVRGNGFLYKQVRSMAGMLIRVGHGQEDPARITELLDTCAARTAHVPSAPPQGLTLWKVWY